MLKEGFWDSLYNVKKNDAVSWHAKRLDLSLNLINQNCSNKSSVIDIGSGRSTLADDLYALGYNKLTLLDISGSCARSNINEIGQITSSNIYHTCGHSKNHVAQRFVRLVA